MVLRQCHVFADLTSMRLRILLISTAVPKYFSTNGVAACVVQMCMSLNLSCALFSLNWLKGFFFDLLRGADHCTTFTVPSFHTQGEFGVGKMRPSFSVSAYSQELLLLDLGGFKVTPFARKIIQFDQHIFLGGFNHHLDGDSIRDPTWSPIVGGHIYNPFKRSRKLTIPKRSLWIICKMVGDLLFAASLGGLMSVFQICEKTVQMRMSSR